MEPEEPGVGFDAGTQEAPGGGGARQTLQFGSWILTGLPWSKWHLSWLFIQLANADSLDHRPLKASCEEPGAKCQDRLSAPDSVLDKSQANS